MTTITYNQSGVQSSPGAVDGGGDRWWLYLDQGEMNLRVTISGGGGTANVVFSYYCTSADTAEITQNASVTTFTTDTSNTLATQTIATSLADGVYDFKIKHLTGSGNFMVSKASFLTVSSGTVTVTNVPGFGKSLNFVQGVIQTTGVAGSSYLLYCRPVAWTTSNDVFGSAISFQPTTDRAGIFTQDNIVRFWADFGTLGFRSYSGCGSSGNPSGVAAQVSDGTHAFNIIACTTRQDGKFRYTPSFPTTSGRQMYEACYSGAPGAFIGIECDASVPGIDTSSIVVVPKYDVVSYMDSITEGDVDKGESSSSHGNRIKNHLGPDWRHFNLGRGGMTDSIGPSAAWPGGNPNALMTTVNIQRLTIDLPRAPKLFLCGPNAANDHFNGSANADVTTGVIAVGNQVQTSYAGTWMVFGNMLLGGTYTDGTTDNATRAAVSAGFTSLIGTYGPSLVKTIDFTVTPLSEDRDFADGTSGGIHGGGSGVHPSGGLNTDGSINTVSPFGVSKLMPLWFAQVDAITAPNIIPLRSLLGVGA